MQLAKDLSRARKFLTRMLRGRKAFKKTQQLLLQQGSLEPGRFRIGVYFADSDVNIYQMRQWYAPLRELSQTHPVLLISRNPAGAEVLIKESGLPVAFTQRVRAIEKLLEQQPLDVILYVNQNQKNFQMMRYAERWHVFINHGESDKMYMISNQYKTYDYAFVAGDAARERLSKALWNYDVTDRTFAIGRPQTDHLTGDSALPHDSRIVVLYAPTWEGDRPAAHYGSIASHGERLVRQLISTGRHRVVYRPHPRSGVHVESYDSANKRIIAALEEANRADPSAGHIVDSSPTLGWQLSEPDVAICDISAMVYDRLATGKPLLVTRPVSPDAEIDQVGYLTVCEWLTADDCDTIDAIVDRVIGDSEAIERNVRWSNHYFGETSFGASTARFHEAIDTLLQRASALKERS